MVVESSEVVDGSDVDEVSVVVDGSVVGVDGLVVVVDGDKVLLAMKTNIHVSG